MPYIEQKWRLYWNDYLPRLCKALRDTAPEPKPGELNYILTVIVNAWLGSERSYARYNAAIGVLECMKLELYRRAVAPYEDEKIAQNGDVY